MCTCVTVNIVAPKAHPRAQTTKVLAGIVTEGSRTAGITAKRNHMWTKVSVCEAREESMWSDWIYALPPRGREQQGLNWAFCTLSIELEIETAKSKRCEKMMWKASGRAGPAEYDPKQLRGLQWVTCRDGSGTHRIKAGLFIIPSAVWRNISRPLASLEVRLLQGETNEAALVPPSWSQSEALLRVPAAAAIAG